MSGKYVPSINYGSKAKTHSRNMEYLKFVGRTIVVHYTQGREEQLKVSGYEGPFLFLLAPRSSLGRIALDISKWAFTEESGQLHARPLATSKS
ncbi:MAG: hypothetical protein M1357_02860 [Candidatus Marsarchaeota archaeon]|nr:hypothetical protein [Candidatus Marsarchaeota archaeon]